MAALDFITPGKLGIGSVVPVSERSPVSSLSCHSNGKRLFAASEGGSRLQVIDCLAGKADRPGLKFNQETISLVHATHHEDCILYTPSRKKSSPSISYMSVYDNKIIRVFRGHSGRVTGLSLSPGDDTFLSASQDCTVRLWDVKSAGCLAECSLPSDRISQSTPPLAVYDSTGLVFGIAAPKADHSGHHLHLYDARNHAAGAFAELTVQQSDLQNAILQAASTSQQPITNDRAALLAQQPWSSMQFNMSGAQILIGAGMGLSIVLDGFEGTIQKVLPSHRPSTAAVSCFTADDKYVLSGNEDGTVDVWQVDTGTVIRRLDTGAGSTPVDHLSFNPAYQQFASTTSRDVGLWIWGN